MPLKDIFVHADDRPEFRGRLDLAVNLAVAHDAHLTAIFVPTLPREKRPRPLPRIPMEVMGRYSRRAVTPEERATLNAWERVRVGAEEVGRAFQRRAGRASIAAHWIYDELPTVEALSLHARFCDVLIVSQPGNRVDAEHLITALELPILMVPKSFNAKRVGTRIMIAWDRSPKALRAVNNARPFLRMASEIKVASVNLEPIAYLGMSHRSDIIEHLARHDIAAERLDITVTEKRVSDAILSAAEDAKSDLIVMGAFGKRRGLRERLLGGVTSDIIQGTRVPLLLTS